MKPNPLYPYSTPFPLGGRVTEENTNATYAPRHPKITAGFGYILT